MYFYLLMNKDFTIIIIIIINQRTCFVGALCSLKQT